MDTRTRKLFLSTIEKFFPRDLCKEMEEYPHFSTSLKYENLNSDFVCGPLRDRVESGEHIVKCVKMPDVLYIEKVTPGVPFNPNIPPQSDHCLSGCCFMISNLGNIVLYKPFNKSRFFYHGNDNIHLREWKTVPAPDNVIEWVWHQNNGLDEDFRCFDFVAEQYKTNWKDRVFNTSYNSTLQFIQEQMSPKSILSLYVRLVTMMNNTMHSEQRAAKQRQKVVKQSSGRIERSMNKIRDELGDLQKAIIALSSQLPEKERQKIFTIGQDGQFIS